MTPEVQRSSLEIRLFGGFEVFVGGGPIGRVRSRSVEWLLALLALRHGREVPRSWLAALLWPESAGEQALLNLRRNLMDLRRALGPAADRLRSPTRDSLLLDLTEAEVDVIAFDLGVGAGDDASLARAVSLYRGPLLEGWTEEWVVPEREQRAEACLEALEALAVRAALRGERGGAEAYLRQAAAIDPLRDATQRRLMELLGANGDIPTAILTFRDYRLRLHRELGIEPDPETIRLFQELRSGVRRTRLHRQRTHGAPSDLQPASDQRPLPASSGRSPLRCSVVTLVFVDLVNSAAMKAALPGGDITARNRAYYEAILEPHRRRIEADLEAFGGRVVNTWGDEHILVFEDAAQAAQWAIALRASHASDPIPTPLGPLQVRMGMHTGAPLVDPQDAQDYIGHEVDYAKRVETLASGGQILLSETTAALVRDAHLAGLSLYRHGEQELKGIGRAPLFELLSGSQLPCPLLLPVDPADSLSGSLSGETGSLQQTLLLDTLTRGRMVGRDAELAAVGRRVDPALQGAGATVMLAGEPGIGKTRLATEAALYAGLRGFRVLSGRCDEEGAAPYQPIVEALLGYLHDADDARLKRAMPPDVACELVRIVPQIASRVQGILQVPRTAPAAAQMALVEAICQFVTCITTHESPLLLFLDDLHWADEGTLALLHALARRAKGLRLVILGTYRDMELTTRHPLERTLSAMNRERLYDRHSLRRLPEPAVAQMVAAILDEPSGTASPFSSAFVSVVHHETEGNPFFIEEVLKHLIEEGAVYREAGQWRLKPLEAFSVPRSIKVTVERRLERLAEPSREALTLAAVIGQQFTFDVLLKASGSDEDRLVEMIEEWLGAHLVVEQRVRREEVYRFQHAQIRAVLSDGLSRRRKIRLHERIAAALDETYGGHPEAYLDELAYHFSQSHGAPGVEKAVEYCLRAGEKARRLYANEEALKHLTTALEFLDRLPQDDRCLQVRWHVVENLRDAYVSRQEEERARRVMKEYLALAESVGYSWGVAAAHYGLGEPPLWQGDWLEKGIEVCEQHGVTDWLARTRSRLAFMLTRAVDPKMRDLPRAEGLLRQTLSAPAELSRAEIQSAYGLLMTVYGRQGRWEESAAVFRESLVVGGPDPNGLCQCLSDMENHLSGPGEAAQFHAFCEEAQAQLSRAGIQLCVNQWYLEPAQPSGHFEPVRFQDDFDATHLGVDWQWHDPIQASAYVLSEQPGYLTIRAAPETNLWPLANLNAPRLLREQHGDFALETRVEGDWDERREVEGSGGLLIWKDALNFLRLDKFSMSAWHNGDVGLQARVNGEFLHFGRGQLRGGTYVLRLERTGERVAALCSTDGETWLACGSALFPAGDQLLVGVHADNGMIAHFDHVRVLGRRTPDDNGTT